MPGCADMPLLPLCSVINIVRRSVLPTLQGTDTWLHAEIQTCLGNLQRGIDTVFFVDFGKRLCATVAFPALASLVGISTGYSHIC